EQAQDFDAWMKRVAGLPANSRAEAVLEKICELNPYFQPLPGRYGYEIAESEVVQVRFFGAENLKDISPLRALPTLTSVRFNHCFHLEDISPLKEMDRLKELEIFQTSVSDLTPLKGKPITRLMIGYSYVKDLRPLEGMKLEYLDAHASHITSLKPLEGVPLTTLMLYGTKIEDLSPLKGMRLKILNLYGTPVKDLSPLTGMPIALLRIGATNVEDLSVLRTMRLKSLGCDFDPNRDTDLIHSIKTLEEINGKNIADFSKVIERTPTARFVAETILREGGRVIIDERADSLSRLDQLPAQGAISISAIDFPASKPIDTKVLQVLPELPTIQSLNASGTSFSDAELAHLRGQSLLKILRLNGTKVTGDGFGHLVGLDVLDWLEVAGAPVTDDGLACLPAFPALTHINLSSTKITDDGLRRWKKPMGLRTLSLMRVVGVTDDGIDALSELKELASLNLVGTGVTAAGVEKLQRLLPKCKIDR
ncbi:MAG: hypothetical protein AB7I37_21325, partial [Pirellulales bacterium]